MASYFMNTPLSDQRLSPSLQPTVDGYLSLDIVAPVWPHLSMIRRTENRLPLTPVALSTSGWLEKQFPAASVTILLAVLSLVSLGGHTNCLAVGAGMVDAVYNFSATDFFVDPFQPYVYASSGASLKAINSSTLAVERSIPLPAASYGMAMSPDGNKLYIAGGSSQSIFVLDTRTWSLLPSLSVGDSPWDLAMGLNNRLFVLGNRLSQIDATTGASAGPDAPVFTYSGALRISPERTTLYYADFGLSPGALYKLDVSSTNLTVVWQNGTDIGENGEQLALNHDGSMVAYVCGYGYNGYQIPNFRTSDMSLLGVFPTGAYPDCLAYSPDDKYAYALHSMYPTAVDIFDVSSYVRIGQFSVVDQAKVMTTDQTGQHLFVAFNNGIYNGHTEVRVYDTGLNTASNQPPVSGPGGPYMAECHGATTVFQLDGSASSDPQGKPLIFTWSADCPGASFDNPASPTPKLTMNAFAAQTCTVTLLVSNGQLTNSAQAVVTVVDMTPPIMNCASNKVVGSGSSWSFDPPSAFDTCCGTNVTITVLGTVTNAPASNQCSVEITRTWQATDCSGNSSVCSQTVTVVDGTPPNLSNLVAYPKTLWPPDNKMHLVTIKGKAIDGSDPAPVFWIASVTSSETGSKRGKDREPDYKITGSNTVLLRAERAGAAKGSIYRIVLEGKDACGNLATSTVVVTVSNSGGKGDRDGDQGGKGAKGDEGDYRDRADQRDGDQPRRQ